MNKRGNGDLGSRGPYYVIVFILVAIAILFAASYVKANPIVDVNSERVEESIVVNRVINCLSEDGEFGIIDEGRINEGNLRECYGKYDLHVTLFKDYEISDSVMTTNVGEFALSKEKRRYVLVDGEGATLVIKYKEKNAEA